MKKQKNDELSALGKSIAILDRQMIKILARRMQIVEEVARYKMRDGNKPVLRKKIEKQRAAQMAQWAREVGLCPIFARVIFYIILSESCRIQIRIKESGKKR